MSHIFISAAHKSSGKTTISIGLCAALHERGLHVSPFKKGPDYIDPMWLSKASHRACYNLDFHNMSAQEIKRAFQQYSSGSDISVIEGNKGLYDGLDLDGGNSNAALAHLLHAPVILVIDAQGMTRGIAPLILGYQAFDPNINIAGVVLNKLGGSRHESKLRRVIEHYTDVPVIGAVHRDDKLLIVERHLGLIPSNESIVSDQHIHNISTLISQQVDLDRIISIGEQANNPSPESEKYKPITASTSTSTTIKIAIARDAAFGFYYPEDIAAFAQCGAELVEIDTLQDKKLPNVDGLFIGGGFPETHIEALSSNSSLREDIRTAIEAGLPCYAECGGLMYLSRSIQWQGKSADMVAALPADTVMYQKPQGRGYVKLIESEHYPWQPHSLPNESQNKQAQYPVHEFHYSALENLDPTLKFAYTVTRGTGVDGKNDGIVYKNLLACYSHFRTVQENQWVHRFVEFVRQHKLDQTNITK